MSDTTSRSSIPQHVGIILDGNRRWARERGLPTLEGHRKGAENFGDIVRKLFNDGVSYVSAFVFSTENWSRTEEEVKYLMKLVVKLVEDELDTFDKAGIRMAILGSRERLSKSVLRSIEKTEETTKNNTKGTLAFCFNYGGHDEITNAVKQIVADGVKPDDITDEVISAALYHPEIPAVDLIVRTSGEQRTSGFMLYRSAYAELLFIDKYWPDMKEADVDDILQEYKQRQRRFGS
ncbi:MAG: di-trans,poly-cis-decaprenylcistransferase [Actinobacteria bacterium]|nr:di-trans,poly-cis-decaprenylcistransferase [Actinomycetota bacterium]